MGPAAIAAKLKNERENGGTGPRDSGDSEKATAEFVEDKA